MSKKRPRIALATATASPSSGDSKLDPGYWRKRLFKCRYTYKGQAVEVRHWSVKIQHLGKRRTFALHSSRRGQAAAEACELYRTLLRLGWADNVTQGIQGFEYANSEPGELPGLTGERFDCDYWAQRLIHREYTMSPIAGEEPELSVRMEHGGTSYYFPLGTSQREPAARRALRIYQTILKDGWEVANHRFARELTVAFRWLDAPLAWTYTTIHTRNSLSPGEPAEPVPHPGNTFQVAVAEPDAGIRRALQWCINRMEGLCCQALFGSAAEVLRNTRSSSAQLVLINHNLGDKPGTACLEELKAAAPNVAGLLYSVYEDSEELFKTTPGGAGIYLLRRTPANGFLEPIAGWLPQERLSEEQMAAAAWQYFKESFGSMPIGNRARDLTSLTQREHEVLDLLSKGHPDKEIADGLGISIHTVHEHVRNIFEKLQVHNRTEAVVKFLQK